MSLPICFVVHPCVRPHHKTPKLGANGQSDFRDNDFSGNSEIQKLVCAQSSHLCTSREDLFWYNARTPLKPARRWEKQGLQEGRKREVLWDHQHQRELCKKTFFQTYFWEHVMLAQCQETEFIKGKFLDSCSRQSNGPRGYKQATGVGSQCLLWSGAKEK